jgi:Flp pilus assembly pilin Flp
MNKASQLLADERGLTATERALMDSVGSLTTLGAILLLGAALTHHTDTFGG